MNHFCTISTVSHLYKVYALAQSLKEQGKDFALHILVLDGPRGEDNPNLRWYSINDVKNTGVAPIIISKYKNQKDRLRWALKPVLMNFLLANPAIEKIIYLDNDLYFFSDYSFLFDRLNIYSIILTPHYYKTDPESGQNWLEANLRAGLYNAGFIGGNRKGAGTLKWWAECCAYRCEKNSLRGLFDDQKYLDLIPVIDESAFMIRHKGCNLAGWNIETCRREMVDGEVKIDGQYPVVFIHFNDITVRRIFNGEDALLKPHYEKYENTLKQFKPGLKRSELLKPEPAKDKMKYMVWKFLTERRF
ncbi:MAG TPA: hypothetical protein VG603_10790 [Chitinophagales bacterium]|nr:hypothetical protein [Chitinophagales bacterium]